MDRLRKSLPPLDTLVFFEAVMRKGGFTAASSELYVSQAAVSKRIRQLEDWLGTPLFERGSRSLTATPEAEKLFEPVSMALDYLNVSLDSIRPKTKSSVRIATNNAVSVFWLLPRIRTFAMSEASCPVETFVSDDPTSLLSGEHDLAIIYGSGPPEGWSGVKLMDEVLVPVIAPDLLPRVRSGAQGLFLLDYDRNAPDWINWDVWARLQAGSALSALPRRRCATYAQSIGRAITGDGIALASSALLQDELAAGRLVGLTEERHGTGKGYFLVHRAGLALHEKARSFFNFLTAQGA